MDLQKSEVEDYLSGGILMTETSIPITARGPWLEKDVNAHCYDLFPVVILVS